MGFESDITQAIGSTGNQTQIILGEKDKFKGRRLIDASKPIKVAATYSGTNNDELDENSVAVSGGDFPKYQPILSGVDLAFLSTLIDSGVFTGTRARAASYPGQFRGQGGFVAGSSPLVTPFLVRALMQDKNPRWHILGDASSKTLPTAVTVVNNQTLVCKTAKTIAHNLQASGSEVKNVVQLKVAPQKTGVASTVTLVNAQTLSGENPIAIANDLTDCEGRHFVLKVTPGDTPTLTETSTPATITIEGRDKDGQPETAELTFSDTAKAVAQTTTERFAEITKVTRTGWSAGTVTIVVEIAAANLALIDGVELGSVRLEGTGNKDEEIAETLYWSAEDFDGDGNLGSLTTDGFFKKVTEVMPSGFAGGAVTITAEDKACRIYINTQDEEPAVYLHGEITRGDTPAVIDDMIISQLILNLSPEEIVRYAIQTIYRQELDQQNLAGEKGGTVKKTDASGLEYPSEDFFVGFQAVMIVDGVTVPAKTVTLTVNQQWQNVGGLSGEQTDEAQPIAITRLTGLTGDFLYSKTNNLNRDYISNKKFSNLELRLQNKLDCAFPAQIRVLMAKGELAANPVPTYSDTGEITQGFEINCLPTRVGAADDIRWIIDVPEYSPLRIYD